MKILKLIVEENETLHTNMESVRTEFGRYIDRNLEIEKCKSYEDINIWNISGFKEKSCESSSLSELIGQGSRTVFGIIVEVQVYD